MILHYFSKKENKDKQIANIIYSYIIKLLKFIINNKKFTIQNNFGLWRLFQCDEPRERMKKFTICSVSGNIYYDDNPLRSIHTHLTEKTDRNMPMFNNIVKYLVSLFKS